MKRKKLVVPLLVTGVLCVAWSVSGQAPAGQAPAGQGGPPAIVKSPPDTFATEIPGVVAAGTRVHLIRDMFQSTEGAIAMPDGSLLFTEQDAGDGRLDRIDKDGNISVYLDNTNRTIGLAYDPKGRLIGAQSRTPRVGVLSPDRKILAEEFEGVPLVFPDDLTIDKRGGIYVVDMLQTRFRPVPAGRTKPTIFYVRPEDGKLIKASDEAASPNGIILSPDEKTLYVSNGPTIAAWDVQPDGTLRNFRTHAALEGLPRNEQGQVRGGGDSICVDGAGRIYVSSSTGVQVISPEGKYLGTIPIPLPPQSVAFAGPDKKTLYVVGRGAVYEVAMLAQGIKGRAK